MSEDQLALLPTAYVPVHPRYGPLWSETHPSEMRERVAERLKHYAMRPLYAQASIPLGFVLAPAEPTPEMIAGASLAAWPTASAADIELARKAARIVMERGTLQPGFTLESLACAIATMAPAYRAMIAAAQEPKK